MESIRVTTFQNITVEYKLASIGDRLLAKIIDTLIRIFSILILLIPIILMTKDFKLNSEAFGSARSVLITLISILIATAILCEFLFYSLFFEAFMNGQTPGKRIMQIKVASIDGRPTSFLQFFLRWIFLIVDNLFLIGLITMSLNDKNQRLGDIIAGTILINVAQIKKTDFFEGISFPDNYAPMFPESYQMTDHDIQIIKEIVNKSHEGIRLPADIITKASQKVKNLLNIQSPLPDLTFIEQIVKDYTYHFEQNQ